MRWLKGAEGSSRGSQGRLEGVIGQEIWQPVVGSWMIPKGLRFQCRATPHLDPCFPRHDLLLSTALSPHAARHHILAARLPLLFIIFPPQSFANIESQNPKSKTKIEI
jgi:hypothetical protein